MLKILVQSLEIGMYVGRLDRPWLETPFLFQGFYIQSSRDIATLAIHCEHVFIDTDKEPFGSTQIKVFSSASKEPNTAKSKLPKRSCTYEDKTLVEDEISFAKQCRQSLNKHYHVIHEDVENGNNLDLSKISKSIEEMVTSIIRNADAFLWLTKLKNIDAYAYNHAIDTSVLAVSFGRHLGLNKEELTELATGVLLCDIGKIKLPKKLLSKPGRLTNEEFEIIKTHVELGVDILQQAKGNSSREIIKIARFHHERHNGHGYPNGLSGQQIPAFARIAAIVDCYDAITTHRSYCTALSALDAIKCMYEWRDIDFQKDLIEEFIQCLGIFPTGCIVELSTGEFGIVLAQNRIRRLRPRVMLVLDKNQRSLEHLPVIDLVKEETDANGNTLEIVRTHESGVYGIDPANFFIHD